VRSDADLLARGPRAGDDEIWRLAWPDAFAPERRAARGTDAKLDPWLVIALMREESGFRPDAVSVTGAVGLLQLMPDTARRLAREVGLGEVPSARWIDPALNVRLATAYLEQLTRRFGVRTAAVVASYNAGPAVVETWHASPGGDPVEWIEAIPYEETRGYVKRVLRSQRVYRTLYR
jgi:soluble lytic murein transglycosylase